jgi:electron transport complex protein RnfB
MPKTVSVVVIDESSCIGCTKCIDVCPVDAIIGATKQTHTVLSESCIGCNLCLPPCPVNCINIVEVEDMDANARNQRAQIAKSRHHARKERLAKQEQEKRLKDHSFASIDMKAFIAASLLRSKSKKKSLHWIEHEQANT